MILAYSVALRANVRPPHGLQVLNTNALQCFYGERAEMLQPLEADLRAFFQANQLLFAQVDILEFRYPTLLREVRELEDSLSRHAEAIISDLERLKGLAQVTVYLPKDSQTPVREKAQSGTEYLRTKRDQARAQIEIIDEVRALAGTGLRDSVVQGERMLLLIERHLAPILAAKITAETGLEAAGPFPPSGFAKLLS